MRVRRCDCCHKDIEPVTGKLLGLKRYYFVPSSIYSIVKSNLKKLSGKEQHYDLCDRCAKFIEDTIKVGVNELEMFSIGWRCPICNRVYSPMTAMCYYCSGEQDKTVVNVTETKVDWTTPTTITGGCDAPEPYYGEH